MDLRDTEILLQLKQSIEIKRATEKVTTRNKINER